MTVSGKKSSKTIPVVAAETKAAKSVSDLCYTLKASLRRAKPPIWRRLKVPGSITLERLMGVLLRVMGFDNSHLSAFIINEREYECYAPGGNPMMGGLSREMRFPLSRFVTEPKTKFKYLYDFGDGWEYAIVAEKIEPYPAGACQNVICTAGKGNYMEDDIGGVWGYQSAIDILSDPEHENYEEWVDMYGTLEEFTRPFDIDSLNEALKSM